MTKSTMNDNRMIRDRYLGCLIGLGVGDALGAPLGFMSPAVITQRHGQARDYLGGGWLLLRPGQVTDSAQMALALARSLVRQRKFDVEDVVRELLAWFESEPTDMDKVVRASLGLMKAGQSILQASKRVVEELGIEANGSASLARCAPVGLLHAKSLMQNVQDSVRQSKITHWNDGAGGACALANLLIAEYVAGRPDFALARSVEYLEDQAVRQAAVAAETLSYDDLHSSGSALDTLQCALWCVLHHNDFEEAVIAAVNLGGEAGAVGALTGALAGARHGLPAIPDRWLEELEGREELTALADTLYQIGWLGE